LTTHFYFRVISVMDGQGNKMRERKFSLDKTKKEVGVMKRFMLLMLALVVAIGVSGFNLSQGYAQTARDVTSFIENLQVGEPVYYEDLTIIPIYTATTAIKGHTYYTTLEEALKGKWLEIKELEGGQVPQVRLTNTSSRYIYIMGGEILTGCKQDRIVGRDVLIGPRSKGVIVPVYCVEQGRWNYESDSFYSKSNLGTYGLRAEAQKAKSGAQSSIWQKITGLNRKMGVSSSSDAYQAAYESQDIKRQIASFERRMEQVPQMYGDTVGVIVGVGGRIVSVDIFANPYLFRKLWPKILRSSALSAISSDERGSLTQREAVEFLRRLSNKRYASKSAIDLGREFSAIDREVNINALVYQRTVIHLAGFSEESDTTYFKDSPDSERRIPVRRR
jgi:hypothetical protein